MINIDYIDIAHEFMLGYHGQYIFLFGGNYLELFTIEDIFNITKHPITGEELPKEVVDYIKLHIDCYNKTNKLSLSDVMLKRFVQWYDESRTSNIDILTLKTNPEYQESYDIVRFYMTATDFQDHFREFYPQDSDQERYERYLAEKVLRERKTIGTWLLRHSSLNRPVEKCVKETLKRRGIKYYAMSYIDDNSRITHILFIYRVGVGWNTENIWFPVFLDCLEFMLSTNNIPYRERINKYIEG